VQLKDYYSILELSPSASGDEIKKAYRRLAHQYHPDKKNDDPYASARFSDIKEAYETLSNPQKKDRYLQQRWYTQSIRKKFRQETVTPVAILKQMLETERYASTLDTHRMDKEGLLNQMLAILSEENIHSLNSFNDTNLNKEIVLAALKSGHLLSYRFVKTFTDQLTKININDTGLLEKIEQFGQDHKRSEYWEKKKIWIILFIVLLICLVIFFAGN
jgi:curved DNA-binding protein CbpA